MSKLQINKHLGKVINGCTIGEETYRQGRQVKLNITCFCGNTFNRWKNIVLNNNALNCGCIFKAKLQYNYNKPLHNTWRGLNKRCTQPSMASYKYYGGKGITVCKEWSNSFEGFESWALANGYKQGLQIDRIDNEGNYEPTNCRFVTPKENSRNKSNNVIVWLDGLVLTTAEASRQLGHYRTYVNSLIRNNKNPYFPRLILNPPFV